MKNSINNQPKMKKAVILLSGGLDSLTCLAMARADGFDCYALSFSYGQRHNSELIAAKEISKQMEVIEHRIVQLDVGQFGASALTDQSIDVPDYQGSNTIPITYVPARNTIFLAIALGFAEAIGAHDIYIGANVVDYSGYPDCRPEFMAAFQHLANIATKAGVEGNQFTIRAPLMHLSKSEIIQAGLKLGIDYGLSVSCYQATSDGLACGRCDSCTFRRQGFEQANTPDPTRYQK